jgi:saccharopine dehydrogenase-like NADP-dependent oxidoreductase
MSLEKARVIAVGGCGGMGRFAVNTVLNFDFVDRIIIADQDGEKAAALARESGPKVGYQEIDVQDYDGLVSLFKEADVVLADVGPYYKFGLPVLKAAIETGSHLTCPPKTDLYNKLEKVTWMDLECLSRASG